MAASQRRWGWHELDTRWAERIVADAQITPGSIVLDVGAGRGALTAPLVKAGARVIAVEAHPGRAAFLRERFGDSIVVVQVDAHDLRLPRRPYHVVANPPFNVTSSLLRRLLQPGSRLLSGRVIVQNQAAARWIEPTAPGARRWMTTFEVAPGIRVPRQAFSPPPHVNTRVLRIQRRPRG